MVWGVGRVSRAAARAVLNRYPKIAFIHIPKCAGSSVRDSLFDGIYPSALRHTRAYCQIDALACRSASEMLGADMPTCVEAVLIHALSDPLARFVSGHAPAHPDVVKKFREWKFITVLREPAARFISAYVFHRYKPTLPNYIDCEFAEFLETERARCAGWIATRYLSGMSDHRVEADPEAAIACALDNLERFFSVGFVEDLDNWGRRTGEALGGKVRIRRANASPKPEIYHEIERSPELRERIEALCAIDRQLYAAARLRFSAEQHETARTSALPEAPAEGMAHDQRRYG